MEIKHFKTVSTDYAGLTCRLYGGRNGKILTDRYHRWLDPARRWHGRLSWTGIGVYDRGRMVGHLIIQIPNNDSAVLFGFIEADNNPHVATAMIGAAAGLISQSQQANVFAPVDLSLWHDHRFTIAGQSLQPLLRNPQQTYYRDLFGHFFLHKFVYRSYMLAIPTSLPQADASDVSIRIADLSDHSVDWNGLYRLTCRAFPDSPASPTLEEFIELYTDPDQSREPDDVIVAVRRRRIVGYCFQKIIDSSLVIKTLAVDPDSQRQGIGRMLYTATLERGARRGCERAYFLHLREDRLIARLRPKESLAVGASVLYHSVQL